MGEAAARWPAWLLPTAAAALGAVAYLIWEPASADLAAALFRVDLFEREGFTLFSTAWYGGHHTPAYSVLYPALGAWTGARLCAAVAAVAATAFVALLAGERGRLAGLLFVPGILASLVSGRLAFTLGAGAATGAVLAAARGRTALAAVAGVLTALCSPVAALFAALAGAALALAQKRGRTPCLHAGGDAAAVQERGPSPVLRAGVALVVGAVVPSLFLIVAFPEGGTFPFVPSAFWPTFAAAVAVAVAAPREWRAVRVGAVLYALVALAAFAIPSPLGGNASRLGTLVVAPVAVLALWPRHKAALAVLALPIAYWALQPPVRDWRRAHDDPSTEAAFHEPVARFLEPRHPARVEIPLTQNHAEAYHLARRFPIARGWNRQLDRERNPLFYDDQPLTPERYLAWLHENAIAYVAVPLGVPMDESAEREKLIALGDPRIGREVFRNEDWRVLATADPRPPADPPATLTEVRPEGFVLNTPQPGASTIRIRFTPYFAVLDGDGCVEPAPGGWTRLRVREAGRIEVGTRFSLGRVRSKEPRCS